MLSPTQSLNIGKPPTPRTRFRAYIPGTCLNTTTYYLCCSLPLATQQTKSACDTTKQPQQLPGSPYKHAHVRTELDNMLQNLQNSRVHTAHGHHSWPHRTVLTDDTRSGHRGGAHYPVALDVSRAAIWCLTSGGERLATKTGSGVRGKRKWPSSVVHQQHSPLCPSSCVRKIK